MATLPELLAMKASLLTAMGSGALQVRHNDKLIIYRSIDELRIAIGEINAQIAEAEGRKRRRQIRIYTGEGR